MLATFTYPKCVFLAYIAHTLPKSTLTIQLADINSASKITCLAKETKEMTSWWFQPKMKNKSQIGSFPQVAVNIKKMFETTRNEIMGGNDESANDISSC